MHKVRRPVHPLTEIELSNWRRPTYAYILFETIEFAIKSGGHKDVVHKLMTLTVEERPERFEAVKFYTDLNGPKKFRLIDWGNFPSANDKNFRRQQKVKMHSGPNGENPWDAMEKLCESLLDVEPKWSKYLFQQEASKDAPEVEGPLAHPEISGIEGKLAKSKALDAAKGARANA